MGWWDTTFNLRKLISQHLHETVMKGNGWVKYLCKWKYNFYIKIIIYRINFLCLQTIRVYARAHAWSFPFILKYFFYRTLAHSHEVYCYKNVTKPSVSVVVLRVISHNSTPLAANSCSTQSTVWHSTTKK